MGSMKYLCLTKHNNNGHIGIYITPTISLYMKTIIWLHKQVIVMYPVKHGCYRQYFYHTVATHMHIQIIFLSSLYSYIAMFHAVS